MKRASPIVVGLATACGGHPNAGEAAIDASADTGPVTVDASLVPDGAADPCADAGAPPSSLACAGLYANFATKAVATNALACTPATPLWSDGAQKQRWIELPAGTTIDISNPNEWTFPVGTKLFKEFRVDGKRVETRMFQKTTAAFWVYATYAWNGDDSDATINFGGPVPVGDGGVTWNIPTNDDCNECHSGRQDRILGFEQVGLGLANAQGLTLAQLAEMGLVTPPAGGHEPDHRRRRHGARCPGSRMAARQLRSHVPRTTCDAWATSLVVPREQAACLIAWVGA